MNVYVKMVALMCKNDAAGDGGADFNPSHTDRCFIHNTTSASIR